MTQGMQKMFSALFLSRVSVAKSSWWPVPLSNASQIYEEQKHPFTFLLFFLHLPRPGMKPPALIIPSTAPKGHPWKNVDADMLSLCVQGSGRRHCRPAFAPAYRYQSETIRGDRVHGKKCSRGFGPVTDGIGKRMRCNRADVRCSSAT